MTNEMTGRNTEWTTTKSSIAPLFQSGAIKNIVQDTAFHIFNKIHWKPEKMCKIPTNIPDIRKWKQNSKYTESLKNMCKIPTNIPDIRSWKQNSKYTESLKNMCKIATNIPDIRKWKQNSKCIESMKKHA